LGYPVCISIIAKLTGFSVFWASKTCNILFAFIGFLILKKYFTKDFLIYSMVFFIPGISRIFTYTWSEVPFIVFLLLLSITLNKFIEAKKTSASLYISLFFICVGLFLSRYIGIFSVGLISLVAIWVIYKKRDFVSASKLLLTASCVGIICFLYLYNNYTQTGFITGMPRIASPESNFQLLKMLSKAQIYELLGGAPSRIISFFYSFLLSWTIYKTMKYKKTAENSSKIYFGVLSVGIIYWLSIVVIRWISQFDGFSFRLLGPSTMLFFIAGIIYLQKNLDSIHYNHIKKVLLSGMIFIFIASNYIYPIYKHFFKEIPNYAQTIESTREKYKQIEDESIVAFASVHLNYLRPSIQSNPPYFWPYFKNKETLAEYLARVKKANTSNLYIEIDKNISTDRFDESIYQFMQTHPVGIVKIKNLNSNYSIKSLYKTQL
ncbi:MAG: hypothetical protein LBR56_06735, partial [Sporomusaceae bacterium]|nr:hypothetical protein [Sporomusaceae bacterium]